MTTQGRITPQTLSAFLEGLPELLEELRAEGYGLGTRQHVATHELIGSLFARGALPDKFIELDEWLAPLICYTPAQQEDFRERYLRWLIAKGLVDAEDLPPAPPPIEIPEPPPTPPPTPVGERIVRRVSAHRRLVIATVVLLFAAAALFTAYYFGAAYLNEEDSTRTVVINPPTPGPTPVPLPADEPTTPTTTTTTPAQDTGLAWDVDKPLSNQTQAADLSKVELKDPLPPTGFWASNFRTLIALTIVPPFAALGLWQVLRRRRQRRDAERFGKERPHFDKIKVRGTRERVFQSAALRPVARGLRHYLSVESRQLDARSTVLASAGRGGLFTPVYGRRRTLPEYLVLIDRVGFGDQLAQFYTDLVARLGERDVYLDTYYFHGDPRRCREGGPDSPQLSLSDLAARHPDHYLLIFSDGTGLLSTTTGRPEPFVEQLLFWRGRALLTSVPRLEWEYREWALEREGLKVLPATLDGLRLLVDVVNAGGRAARVPDFDETPPYPDILIEQPALWQERDAPAPHQTRRLVSHLRRYLGPRGFELLCACAVYPLMQWGVTLFLAYELLGRGEVEELLPRLLRLPWFRQGTMPQWLRRALVRELPRARRRVVRERLEHLLLDFLEDPERGVRPRFAEESDVRETAARASLLTRLRERLAAWQRSRRLRRRLAQAPARSPLAEPVFLKYITDNQRTEALPEPIRKKLFRRGVAAFGLRLAPAAALVTVAVLTGLFLLLLERPVEEFYTPGFPSDLMSRLLVQPSAQTTDPDFNYTPTSGERGKSYVIKVNPVRLGAYDLSGMSISPAAGAASGLTLQTARASKSALYVDLAVAKDAPAGSNELLLYDGDRLRAHLPFNVAPNAAANATPLPTPVPIAVPLPGPSLPTDVVQPPAPTPTPTPVLSIFVNPQAVTVCPSNPKLNDPPNSVLSVTVNTNQMIDVLVSDGKTSAQGVSRAGYQLYAWDMTGLSPGTYTITARPAAAAASTQSGPPPQAVTQEVTVKSCVDTGSAPAVSAAYLNDALETTDDLKGQVNGLDSNTKEFVDSGLITNAEERAISGASARLKSALNTLANNLKVLRSNPSFATAANLPQQVNAVYTALKELEAQVSQVKDDKTRSLLDGLVKTMQSRSAYLRPQGAAARPR